MFGRIDHIGVAVEDLDAAIEFYEKSLEMTLIHRETVEAQGVEAALFEVGDGHVELMEPLEPETPVDRFLARGGTRLHHVAYAVDDIEATLERLTAAGIEPIDSKPRLGMLGSRVAFLEPGTTGKVLIELTEPASRAQVASGSEATDRGGH